MNDNSPEDTPLLNSSGELRMSPPRDHIDDPVSDREREVMVYLRTHAEGQFETHGEEHVRRMMSEGFLERVKHWVISDQEAAALLGLSVDELLSDDWTELLEVDHVLRIVGLSCSLHLAELCYGRDEALRWLRSENPTPFFGGQVPMDVMMQADLFKVVRLQDYMHYLYRSIVRQEHEASHDGDDDNTSLPPTPIPPRILDD